MQKQELLMFCMEKKILQFHLLLPEKQADFVAFVTICQHFSWKGKKGVQGIQFLSAERPKPNSKATVLTF